MIIRVYYPACILDRKESALNFKDVDSNNEADRISCFCGLDFIRSMDCNLLKIRINLIKEKHFIKWKSTWFIY